MIEFSHFSYFIFTFALSLNNFFIFPNYMHFSLTFDWSYWLATTFPIFHMKYAILVSYYDWYRIWRRAEIFYFVTLHLSSSTSTYDRLGLLDLGITSRPQTAHSCDYISCRFWLHVTFQLYESKTPPELNIIGYFGYMTALVWNKSRRYTRLLTWPCHKRPIRNSTAKCTTAFSRYHQFIFPIAILDRHMY